MKGHKCRFCEEWKSIENFIDISEDIKKKQSFYICNDCMKQLQIILSKYDWS